MRSQSFGNPVDRLRCKRERYREEEREKKILAHLINLFDCWFWIHQTQQKVQRRWRMMIEKWHYAIFFNFHSIFFSFALSIIVCVIYMKKHAHALIFRLMPIFHSIAQLYTMRSKPKKKTFFSFHDLSLRSSFFSSATAAVCCFF